MRWAGDDGVVGGRNETDPRRCNDDVNSTDETDGLLNPWQKSMSEIEVDALVSGGQLHFQQLMVKSLPACRVDAVYGNKAGPVRPRGPRDGPSPPHRCSTPHRRVGRLVRPSRARPGRPSDRHSWADPMEVHCIPTQGDAALFEGREREREISQADKEHQRTFQKPLLPGLSG